MSKTKNISRGEIWFADLEPTTGSEQGGKRPIVVISGNVMNSTLPISLCCPISSKVKNYPASLILTPNTENGLRADSEVIVFQARTISHKRLTKKIGRVTSSDMEKIHTFLRHVCEM